MHQRWRAITDASPFFVLVIARDGTIVDINRTLPGMTREQVIGRDSVEFLPPEDVDEARQRLERVFATGVAETSEARTSDGHWFSVRTIPVIDDGVVQEIVLLTIDDTAVKLAQEELVRRERVFRALVEKSTDGFALLHADGQIFYSSPSTARITGLGASELVDAFSVVHPDDIARARALLERVKQTKEPVRERLRILRGTEVRTLDLVLANHLDDADVHGIISNFRDVTDLERAEQERDRFFELSPDLMSVTAPDGYFKRLNPAWEQTLGWTSAEMLERPYADFIHPDDLDATTTAHEHAQGSAVTGFENRFRCRDGTYRWLQWRSSFDAHTRLVYGIARDVTAKKRVDEQMLHAQKMEAIGRLAGGVAHDINNMLAVIYASTELILDELPAASSVRADINDIQHVAQRSAELVRQLLAFSRKSPRSTRAVALDDAVAAVSKMLDRVIGDDVRVIRSSRTGARVKADPAELESMLMNLALNARDAMPAGGDIELGTETRDLDAARASELGVAPGRYAVLSVRDSGTGIAPGIRGKIFEPFFTTKDVGKGTGLGLSMVFAVAEQCGGAVDVATEANVGSTFSIFLPSLDDAEPDAVASTRAPRSGGHHVLLVEDAFAERPFGIGFLQKPFTAAQLAEALR